MEQLSPIVHQGYFTGDRKDLKRDSKPVMSVKYSYTEPLKYAQAAGHPAAVVSRESMLSLTGELLRYRQIHNHATGWHKVALQCPVCRNYDSKFSHVDFSGITWHFCLSAARHDALNGISEDDLVTHNWTFSQDKRIAIGTRYYYCNRETGDWAKWERTEQEFVWSFNLVTEEWSKDSK